MTRETEDTDIPQEVEKSLHLTDWDLQQLEEGETIYFPHGDKNIVLGLMEDVETATEERYYVE